MRFRAVAAPSNQSNAVGSVELECGPQGLLLVHLGVAAYAQGYAPAAVTTGTSILVPWAALEEVRVGSTHTFLAIASGLTPLNRLCLTHFSHESAPTPEMLKRRRWILWAATLALTAIALLAIATLVPRWTASTSAGSVLALGTAAAAVVLLLGWFVDARILHAGPDSATLMLQFVSELKFFRPKPILVGPGPASPDPAPLQAIDLIHYLPRSTWGVIIVLTAGGLAALLTGSWLLEEPDGTARRSKGSEPAARSVQDSERQDGETQERATPQSGAAVDTPPQAAANAGTSALVPSQPGTQTLAALMAPTSSQPAAPLANADVITAGESCRCERAASALWSLEFPRLSTLLIEQRTRAHKEHQHLELELAVVNNGNKALDEVNLSVQFYEDEGKTATRLRPLHYPGSLQPGQAVKWHVEARATSFVVNNPVREVLGQDRQTLASADQFAELLKANHRPVRLHAAMMLAYLGDARAKAGALRLRDAFSEAEMPYLDRVLATQGDVITCDWRASDQGRHRDVSACVFNVSSKPLARVGIKARALDRVFDYRNPVADPPLVIAEKVAEVAGNLPPAQGVRAIVSVDTDNPDGKPAAAFELLADSIERL